MITSFDYISIAFYFIFVVTVGVVFSRRNKNTSDYFRGGGIMPWWMAGVSAWMASFSAWTFTGAAGKIYSQGFYVLLLYYSSIAALCHHFGFHLLPLPADADGDADGGDPHAVWRGDAAVRDMAAAAVPDAVRRRGLEHGGRFMSGAFGIATALRHHDFGRMVTFVSLVGGAFGVAASDFVQMFLVVTMTLVISAFALAQPAVGGFPGCWFISCRTPFPLGRDSRGRNSSRSGFWR